LKPNRLIHKVGIFPSTEVGLTTNLAKKFYFMMINMNEYVFKSGETAEEIFFLLEGTVTIRDDGNEVIADLEKNSYFGEMAIMAGKTGIHTVLNYDFYK
jgi:signal-transduction protein with cAMP-binding, CBS, and nucleotidyltransferase domain